MIDWSKVLLPQVPVLESIVRMSLVYLSLVFMLRVVLKREAGNAGVSDVLVLVMLADAVQNGMSGQSFSVADALVLAATLLFWDWALDYLSFRYKWFYRLLHPRSRPIIMHGEIMRRNCRRELLTMDDIKEALRREGIKSVKEVEYAFVESNGAISVIPKKDNGTTSANGTNGHDATASEHNQTMDEAE